MKQPRFMTMDELLSLPIIAVWAAHNRVQKFGGCFKDREGLLWATGLIDQAWVRYPSTLGST